MQRFNLILAIGLVFTIQSYAQKNTVFKASVTNDSILLGNYFVVRFQLDNAEGANFSAPDFEGFDVVSGPSTSRNVSIINGVMSQQMSFSYHLKPRDIGNYYIEPASVEVEGQFLETEPIAILVVPNPDGIDQNQLHNQQQLFSPWGWDQFDLDRSPSTPVQPKPAPETKKKKKKRKIVKI